MLKEQLISLLVVQVELIVHDVPELNDEFDPAQSVPIKDRDLDLWQVLLYKRCHEDTLADSSSDEICRASTFSFLKLVYP